MRRSCEQLAASRVRSSSSWIVLSNSATISRTPAWKRFAGQPPLPVAERAGDQVLSLPLSPAHSDDDIADVVAALRRVHERFAG